MSWRLQLLVINPLSEKIKLAPTLLDILSVLSVYPALLLLFLFLLIILSPFYSVAISVRSSSYSLLLWLSSPCGFACSETIVVYGLGRMLGEWSEQRDVQLSHTLCECEQQVLVCCIGMRLFSCSNVKKFFFEHSVQTLCSKSMYTKFEHLFESVRTLFEKCSNTFLKVFEHFLKSVRTQKKKCSNTKKKVFEH